MCLHLEIFEQSVSVIASTNFWIMYVSPSRKTKNNIISLKVYVVKRFVLITYDWTDIVLKRHQVSKYPSKPYSEKIYDVLLCSNIFSDCQFRSFTWLICLDIGISCHLERYLYITYFNLSRYRLSKLLPCEKSNDFVCS